MDLQTNEGNFVNNRAKRKLTVRERHTIIETLLKESVNGRVAKGFMPRLASQFSVIPRSIRKLWQKAKEFMANGSPMTDVAMEISKRVRARTIEIDHSKVKAIPFNRRKTIRALASALDMKKSTIHRRFKEGGLKRHTNTFKPLLTDDNKRQRLEFCYSMIDLTSFPNPKFINMYNYVHVDEKWFYMTKECQTYYLLPEEKGPLRTCKSKRFITKVMFLTAVARPRFDSYRGEMFSGKIGMFPFIFKEPAKRRSKNRVVGTMEMKPITSVTKDVYRSYLIDKVLPSIREKWPYCDKNSVIYIQQDNAKPHIERDDPAFIVAAQEGGFNMELCFQPPNSPDMNVLDLGYFRAIQSLQQQEAPKSVDDLIEVVKKSFDQLSLESLSNVFLSLQLCMKQVMRLGGGNNYDPPHIGKTRLQQQGLLPIQIECEQELVNEVALTLQGN